MDVLHLNWARGALRFWAESAGGPPAGDVLARRLVASGLAAADEIEPADPIGVTLPCDGGAPRPSERMSGMLGEVAVAEPPELHRVEVPTVALRNDCALSVILRIEDHGPGDELALAHSVPYWIAVGRFALELLADQRFIPTLIHAPDRPAGALRGAWRPWLHDEAAQARVTALLAAMPPVVRAVDGAADADDSGDAAFSILYEALTALCDATVRRALAEAHFLEAIEGRDAEDPQVAWLGGLLGRDDRVAFASEDTAAQFLREAGGWLSRLQEDDRSRPFHLCFRLEEPLEDGADPGPATWPLRFQLRLDGDPPVLADAERVWSASTTALMLEGRRIDRPQEWLLAELGRASRICAFIERALAEAHPVGIDLSTEEAAQFLRDHREVLDEAGFGTDVPEWWDRRTARLGLRLRIDSPADAPAGGEAGSGRLGLDSLVRFRWQIAVGEEPLTADELRRIAASASPLIRVGDRWVENEAERLARAAAVVERHGGGELTLREAMRLARGAGDGPVLDSGLPVLGMDADGWVGRILAGGDGPQELPRLPQPRGFVGALRPYQKTGLSWLAFLERFGFGACLADDMGLGKTIQLIGLLLHERENGRGVGPTLLVVPTSLIGNWSRELGRFAPELRHYEHHGPQRRAGDEFAEAAASSDVVITTYALVPRDLDSIGVFPWWRVVLDEAQYIKNPPTRQASAIRRLAAPRRVALTGTPVENRLAELWSIMEFCNPGYLGSQEEFRRRCAVPIERHRDSERAAELRRLVHPFILRRLKTDPGVADELPPCVETREFATLTAEQAALYQATVDELLASVEGVEGIQRRGRVLAALTRLKQVCNHPEQLPSEASPPPGARTAPADPRRLARRSGKCMRLMQMLEELIAAGDRALIFTQYRRMGELLSAMIRQELDCDTMFMHGGTPTKKRQAMIDRFQAPRAGPPAFILSLKTGGVGLNLTAANHVFHFDRWWNPAVENQATDRAFRIGQTRTVHVHKFVCAGTLEERIDQMIEQKTELADNIVGSGEDWITELSADRLHEILKLRAEAMEVDG